MKFLFSVTVKFNQIVNIVFSASVRVRSDQFRNCFSLFFSAISFNSNSFDLVDCGPGFLAFFIMFAVLLV